MQREQTHKPADDHGTEVAPIRVIPPDAGWLRCPKNAGHYSGENEPWRR